MSSRPSKVSVVFRGPRNPVPVLLEGAHCLTLLPAGPHLVQLPVPVRVLCVYLTERGLIRINIGGRDQHALAKASLLLSDTPVPA